MHLHINLPGYEDLKVTLNSQGEIESYQLQCSSSTLKLFEDQLLSFGRKLAQWTLPPMDAEVSPVPEYRRSYLLLTELILKSQNLWLVPYQGEIVCTCRQVSSESIDQSIAAGANTVDTISVWTTACTSCTSCKTKIEEILGNRLGSNFERIEELKLRKVAE